jgi:hypothetical protein
LTTRTQFIAKSFHFSAKLYRPIAPANVQTAPARINSVENRLITTFSSPISTKVLKIRESFWHGTCVAEPNSQNGIKIFHAPHPQDREQTIPDQTLQRYKPQILVSRRLRATRISYPPLHAARHV